MRNTRVPATGTYWKQRASRHTVVIRGYQAPFVWYEGARTFGPRTQQTLDGFLRDYVPADGLDVLADGPNED